MTYLLDTNACIELLNERNSLIARKLARVAPPTIAICSVVKAELYHGAYKSNKREANLDLLARFFQRFISLHFDDNAAEQYGISTASCAPRSKSRVRSSDPTIC